MGTPRLLCGMLFPMERASADTLESEFTGPPSSHERRDVQKQKKLPSSAPLAIVASMWPCLACGLTVNGTREWHTCMASGVGFIVGFVQRQAGLWSARGNF